MSSIYLISFIQFSYCVLKLGCWLIVYSGIQSDPFFCCHERPSCLMISLLSMSDYQFYVFFVYLGVYFVKPAGTPDDWVFLCLSFGVFTKSILVCVYVELSCW
jgi:hypothetical protein